MHVRILLDTISLLLGTGYMSQVQIFLTHVFTAITMPLTSSSYTGIHFKALTKPKNERPVVLPWMTTEGYQ